VITATNKGTITTKGVCVWCVNVSKIILEGKNCAFTTSTTFFFPDASRLHKKIPILEITAYSFVYISWFVLFFISSTKKKKDLFILCPPLLLTLQYIIIHQEAHNG
ncbi:hypothetical protein MEO_02410, partial [Candida albicans P94015]